MAGLVGLQDAKGEPVWINPSWVKMVTTTEAGGVIIEFMDGERLPLSSSLKSTLKRLQHSLVPPSPASPAPEPSKPEATPAEAGGGVRSLLRQVAVEA